MKQVEGLEDLREDEEVQLIMEGLKDPQTERLEIKVEAVEPVCST